MPYLIDGHNLIPKIPGLSLENPDDEQQLIDLLQAFCRARRQKIEVFFDQAPTGMAGSRQAGLVKVHSVSRRSSADDAIRRRLERIGREAPNWKVVSSDRQVQAEARSRRAEVISAEAFAETLQSIVQGKGESGVDGGEVAPGDIDEWLRIFSTRRKE
jgi:predicted RNA-binding protein with PIN domain